MTRTLAVFAGLLAICLARECFVCEEGSVSATVLPDGQKMTVDESRFTKCTGKKTMCQADQDKCASASITATVKSSKDGKEMEAVFKIDALKGCASKEDTCAHFKADIQASVDAESSESANTVSLDKCVVKKCGSDNCNDYTVSAISSWEANSTGHKIIQNSMLIVTAIVFVFLK